MRIVFDTNVLISAVQFGGLPRLALQLAIQSHSLLASAALLEEFERVLIHRFKFPAGAAEKVLNEYRQTCKLVHPTALLHVIAADPSDNRVLECAVYGKADWIVSGDADLLSLKRFRKIPILTVREFVNIIHSR